MEGWLGFLIPIAAALHLIRAAVRQQREAERTRHVPLPLRPGPLPPRSKPRAGLPSAMGVPRPKLHRSLGTVRDGEFVVVTGRIQSGQDSLTAPLSGMACVGYVAVAQAWNADGMPPPLVDVVEMKIAPVVIALHDGEVVVDGECVVRMRTTAVSPCIPEREAAFLAKRQLQHCAASTELAEAVLRVGDRVWVSGVMQRDRSGEHGYRELAERIRLVSRPGRPLTIGRARRLPRRRPRARR